MLFVVGVTFLAIGTIITAGAGMIFQDRIGPTSFRRLLNSQALSVIMATFMGAGLMILFLFIVEFRTQTFGIAEALLTLAIAAASAYCVRRIARRHRVRYEHPNIASGHPA
ncbi:MAG: hypothetical protein IH626_23935 [Rhodospirillales bacterium]|nr:hypothetical protein [Rhodospirillales bacterium]